MQTVSDFRHPERKGHWSIRAHCKPISIGQHCELLAAHKLSFRAIPSYEKVPLCELWASCDTTGSHDAIERDCVEKGKEQSNRNKAAFDRRFYLTHDTT